MTSLLLLMKATPDFSFWTGPRSQEFPLFTVRQVSIFFHGLVFFQVWNEINCRSMVPDVSGFHGLFNNVIFLASSPPSSWCKF